MEIIIGAAVSLLVEWLKSMTTLSGWKTLAVVAAVSIIAALIYTYFVSAGYWQTVVQLLIVAGAFYTFIIQRFEKQ